MRLKKEEYMVAEYPRQDKHSIVEQLFCSAQDKKFTKLTAKPPLVELHLRIMMKSSTNTLHQLAFYFLHVCYLFFRHLSLVT